jgi:O-antigen/teichoic acid export membrane protein
VRQNLILLVGAGVSGVGGFVYHAVAGRALGPKIYGEVGALVALYTVGTTINLILILILARYAADLFAQRRDGGLRSIIERSAILLAPPTVVFILLGLALSPLVARFEHLSSPVPVIWLVVAVAACWYMALPRGVLQGTQRFTGLSVNMSLELAVRMVALIVLVWLGTSTSGAMIAILLGVAVATAGGTWALRDVLTAPSDRVRMRVMLSFAVTAAAGTIGVLLLYNLDVVLAAHYLDKHGTGIYTGLNKMGTILYFGTLSVGQVLFPRVVEAIATRRNPGLMLLLSAGLIAGLGLCAIAVFAVAPQLVVGLLFGSQFSDAQAYLLPMGFAGLGLSLNNLLTQFFMAVHDRIFIPLLAAGCVLEVVLIYLFHHGVAEVVTDVVVVMWALLAALTLRAVLLLPRLRPEMVDRPATAAGSDQTQS